MSDCAICRHEQVQAIDAALRSGMVPPAVARRFNVPAIEIFRHRRFHVADLPQPDSATKPAPEPIARPAHAAPAQPLPATKPQPPNRAPVFREMPAKQYVYLWTMQPHAIARKLTPQERLSKSR